MSTGRSEQMGVGDKTARSTPIYQGFQKTIKKVRPYGVQDIANGYIGDEAVHHLRETVRT